MNDVERGRKVRRRSDWTKKKREWVLLCYVSDYFLGCVTGELWPVVILTEMKLKGQAHNNNGCVLYVATNDTNALQKRNSRERKCLMHPQWRLTASDKWEWFRWMLLWWGPSILHTAVFHCAPHVNCHVANPMQRGLLPVPGIYN